MLTRPQACDLIDKITATIWLIRDEFLNEEPKAADRMVVAVMEMKYVQKELLRQLPPPHPTPPQEVGAVTTEPPGDREGT